MSDPEVPSEKSRAAILRESLFALRSHTPNTPEEARLGKLQQLYIRCQLDIVALEREGLDSENARSFVIHAHMEPLNALTEELASVGLPNYHIRNALNGIFVDTNGTDLPPIDPDLPFFEQTEAN